MFTLDSASQSVNSFYIIETRRICIMIMNLDSKKRPVMLNVNWMRKTTRKLFASSKVLNDKNSNNNNKIYISYVFCLRIEQSQSHSFVYWISLFFSLQFSTSKCLKWLILREFLCWQSKQTDKFILFLFLLFFYFIHSFFLNYNKHLELTHQQNVSFFYSFEFLFLLYEMKVLILLRINTFWS